MIDNHSVLSDIPFSDLFTFGSNRDPYRGFRESYARTMYPATGVSDTVGRRGRRKDIIIPIHVEGRNEPPVPRTSTGKVHHHIDLTDENFNNNSQHNNSRTSRRHQTRSQHHNNTAAGKSTSDGISMYSLSQSQHTGRTLSSKDKTSDSSELSEELIDLCMYEDMCESDSPDCYISESYDDTSKSSKSECVSTELASQVGKNPSSSNMSKGKSITPTPSYTIYTFLKAQLVKDGRLIDYIRGDGNCFFRALSKDIYGSEDFHDEVRQAVVDLLEKYSKEFEQFLDSGMSITDHIKDMRKNTTWATSAEIYAAATLVQRDIYVLSPDHTGEAYNWMLFKPRFIYTRDTSYHPCFITLCHTHGNHYDRITPKDGACNCDYDPPVLSGIQAYVDLTN